MTERNRAIPRPADRSGTFESELAKVLSSDSARPGGNAITLAINRVCDAVGDRQDGFREVATRRVFE